jgi:response regulator RpfG family c-di-GMP phosphodiesterase
MYQTTKHAQNGSFALLAERDPAAVVQRALEAAREMLGMQMAYVADVRDGRQDYRAVTGDGASFGARVGHARPLDGTLCQAMLAGRVRNIVHDASTDRAVRDLPVTAADRIGSYVGVPVRLSDGTLYGTFCCLSHEPRSDLRERDVRFMLVLARLIGDQLEAQERSSDELEQLVAQRTREVQEARFENLRRLALAAEFRDDNTHLHTQRVGRLAELLAQRLHLPEQFAEDLRLAAPLHDVGKVGIPDAILLKEGLLTADERWMMQTHTTIGASILVGSEFPVIALGEEIARTHHERWDGTGYPSRLMGDEIPISGRIVAVADVFDALTHKRPYKPAWTIDEAMAEMVSCAGTQFDPDIVAALEELYREGELARILDDNPFGLAVTRA